MRGEHITRLNFVQNMVESGLTYDQANRAYNSVMSTFADGFVNGRRVYLGQIGVLNPSIMPPRQVKMGFAVKKGREVVKQQRVYFLDSRVKYSFRLFKKFARTHELKWV
ncbi:MAG: hypothetical protein ACOYB3_00970 [Azonexus sp.]